MSELHVVFGAGPHTFSYVVDFGRLLATLGTREDAIGQIWFTPSPPPVTQAELVTIELDRFLT